MSGSNVIRMPVAPLSPADAEAQLGLAKDALATAATPDEKNRARLGLEVLRDAYGKAAQAGAVHLVGLHREAQLLALEAAVTVGATALGPASKAGTQRVPVKKLARDLGMANTTLRSFAALALARREHEAKFDALVRDALDAGKPIPLTKLRALVKGERKKSREPEAGEEQIALRVPGWIADEIDARLREGQTRTEWLRDELKWLLSPELHIRLEDHLAKAREDAAVLAKKDRSWKDVAKALDNAQEEIAERSRRVRS